MQCFLSTFILHIAQFNSGVTKCDQHSPYGTTGKKTQELDTSLIASIPKSLLRTLRTFAQQEATRGLVLCQMTALLVLDPAPAAKLEGKSGGQAGQQWVLTQSLPQSFLVYSISNAIQYIEFVYMYHIYIHNNTIPYYPIISLFFGPSLKKHRRGAASVRSATSIMKGAPDCLVPGCPRGATSNRRSPIQSFVVFHHIHIVYI